MSSKLTFENFVPVKFFGMERREENLVEDAAIYLFNAAIYIYNITNYSYDIS